MRPDRSDALEKHALVVDDEPSLRELATRILRRRGWIVVTARDAAEAERILGSTLPITLMITDVEMPGMPGDALARQVVERWPRVRALVISGGPAQDFGGDRRIAFLPKPFGTSDLLDAVDRLTGSTE
jgi:DNA-binding NtrC family response regulator